MQSERKLALTPALAPGRNDSDGNRRKQRKRRVSKAPVRVEGAHGVHHSVSVPESEKVGFMLFPHLCSLCCLLFNCMVPARGAGWGEGGPLLQLHGYGLMPCKKSPELLAAGG